MHHSVHPDHARHDPSLVAGHAAGDLADNDSAAAADLLASCTSCAELHRDLVAISRATRALPRTARAPRDFRITDDQAARLHRGSWLRTLLQPFGSARSATRPFAAAFTSLGLAGLLVATFVPGLLGSPTAAPARDAAAGAAGPSTAPELAPQAAGPTNAAAPVPMSASSADPGDLKDAGSSGEYVAIAAGSSPETDEGRTLSNTGGAEAGLQGAAASPPNGLLLASIGLVLLGLAMFGLRFAARRLR